MNLFPNDNEIITGSAVALRRGELSCVELVERCLNTIDERDAEIHAWIRVEREAALARAQQLDEELANGHDLGPLHGIPVGIKDIVDVAGLPTQCGFEPFADRIAREDAAVVSLLRSAGAIILGKTVTTQFAGYDPPVTRNPWNTAHTPGGSSSGSAAAVASGMCLAAIGSQTGGSITRPAAFCGIAGCKPTFGRIPTTGVYPLAPSLDHPGPFARTIGDLTLLMDCLCGLKQDNTTPVASPPRIGRLRGWFEQDVDDEMLAAFETTLASLADSDATVTEAALPPSFDDVPQHHLTVMLFEQARTHRQTFAEFPDAYRPGFAGQIAEGSEISQTDYDASCQHQRTIKPQMDALFETYDLLASPAALGAAPDPSTTGNPAMNLPFSYTGLPTVTFPMSLSAGGLPLGIQLAGRSLGEAALLRWGAWCEQAVNQSH